jgi:type I restriction enzyme S subunit
MMQTLSGLCAFADGRVAVADLDLDSYISTENMLPNKGGILGAEQTITALREDIVKRY